MKLSVSGVSLVLRSSLCILGHGRLLWVWMERDPESYEHLTQMGLNLRSVPRRIGIIFINH